MVPTISNQSRILKTTFVFFSGFQSLSCWSLSSSQHPSFRASTDIPYHTWIHKVNSQRDGTYFNLNTFTTRTKRFQSWALLVAPLSFDGVFNDTSISMEGSSNSDVISFDENGEIIVEKEDTDDGKEWISDHELVKRATSSEKGEAITNRNSKTLKRFRYAGLGAPNHEDEISGENIMGAEITSEHNDHQSIHIEKETKDWANTDSSERKPRIYTEEEEELIKAMGGKGVINKSNGSLEKKDTFSREPGYLGDCTLREIASDFSVPICYIADVLVTWGCPIPIDTDAILGDLVTGEHAFALLEAIHTLDMSTLHDRYSDDDIITIADEYEIDLKDAFDYATKKGWSLPFGVRTFLRREQEDELINALGNLYD